MKSNLNRTGSALGKAHLYSGQLPKRYDPQTFPWHSYAGLPNSSQVACINAFGHTADLDEGVSNKVFSQFFGSVFPETRTRNRPRRWKVELEYEEPSLLNEFGTKHPSNGANYIAVYLSPNLDAANPRGIRAGVWKVRLIGEEVRDGRFHAWIERDDPTEVGRFSGERFLRFPSFFSERSNVDTHSISSLGCGHNVIAVANLDSARQRINVTSSQGPTRDGRLKPDICAPGTDIRAAKGFAPDDELWVAMTGTSMASPYAAGVIGLMLAVNPRLTAAQCLGILQRTSNPLPGASFEWRDDAGFGAIDPARAISEARSFSTRKELS